MKILRISASDTIEIRHKMLRSGRARDTAIFPRDEDDQSFHLGAFHENRLVSVASFYFENHPDLIHDQYQYRLRGMATLPEYQGQGHSSALLKMAFPIIKLNQGSLLWCNARETALGYYQKVGFEKKGESFHIPQIGQHILMYHSV